MLSTMGVIGNSTMGFHGLSILIPMINLIIDVLCVVYSIKTKRWLGAAICVYAFASFVLFPFLWYTTGGTMSSSLPLVIGLGVVLAIIFDGKLRSFFFFSTLILYSVLIIIELYNPNNFVPYPNREAWYWDVLLGFVLSFLASGGLAYFTLMRYNAEKKKANALVQQLELINATDPLTGVFNRRYLMACLDEQMRKSYDDGESLLLCILDIDHFKSINDNYGHVYGDEVLIKLASTIKQQLGDDAIFGRYGGEEFIAVFPGCDLSRTLMLIDGCYRALASVDWTHGKDVTISTGVSIYSKGISYSKFLEMADANLYKAKHNGRNRVEH